MKFEKLCRRALLGAALVAAGGFAAVEPVKAAESQRPTADRLRRSGGSPSRGLRPIGTPRPAAAFARPANNGNRFAPPAAGAGIMRTAYMQGGGFATPPENQLQAPPLSDEGTATTSPPTSSPLPDGLQPVPSTGAPLTAPPTGVAPPLGGTIVSPSDATPLPQPRLGSTWSTADNCNLVTGPSGYRAEFGMCTPGVVAPVAAPAYVPPPAVVVPPTVMPGAVPVVPAVPATVGHRPLFTLGQENYNVQLGQGIIGQPTAYVPGQHFRNFIRYLSP